MHTGGNNKLKATHARTCVRKAIREKVTTTAKNNFDACLVIH